MTREADNGVPADRAWISASGSILRVIGRAWARIALITLAVAVIAWMLASFQPDRYRASALAAVAPRAETLEPNDALRSVEVLERRTVVTTVAALAATPVMRTKAAIKADYDIDTVVLPNTNLFRVDVEGTNAAEAAAIANRIPQLLNVETQAMYKYYGVTPVSPAVAPTAPFAPRPMRALVAGAFIGLLLGLLTAFATQWRAARAGSVP